MNLRRLLGLSFVLAAAACRLSPNVDLLTPWTLQLRDSQPDDPFILVYRKGDRRLIFVAANHETDPASKTFALIDRSFSIWPVKAVIVEGVPTSLGVNPHPLQSLADERPRPDGIVEGGETVPAVQGARRVGAAIWGGEADNLMIKKFASSSGVSDADLLGFYVLRVVPQWSRERAFERLGDERFKALVERQLQRSRQALGVPGEVLSRNQEWNDWYRATNNKAVYKSVDVEEVGPLADGPWPTNRISERVAKARDAHLLRLIARRIEDSRSVMVIFGGSHALIVRSALDSMLGTPCYVGARVDDAKAYCGGRN